MRWKKLGIIWSPSGSKSWAKSHASCPTPWHLNSGVLRIFVTCLDDKGRGRPGWVDVNPSDPTKILATAENPLFELGRPGSFDDNGLVVSSVTSPGPGILHLYYAGFELCTQVRYRILTGLAISRDGGKTFQRNADAPVLERSHAELFFRCGPFASYERDQFRLWYVGGSEWTGLGGKEVPVYDLRYAESKDGIHWPPQGRISLALNDADEHGFGRPWVRSLPQGGYELYYSIRKRSAGGYRLGYATSLDGITWQRDDATLGLDVSPDGFDSEAMMYSAVIESAGKTWCFYNGNGFGKDGIGLAVRED